MPEEHRNSQAQRHGHLCPASIGDVLAVGAKDIQSVVYPCGKVHNLLASNVTERKVKLVDRGRTAVPRDGVWQL